MVRTVEAAWAGLGAGEGCRRGFVLLRTGGRASCGGGRKVQDHGGGDELAERVGDHLVRHQDKEYAHVITCQS